MDSKALSASIANFAAKFCNELVKDKSVVSSPLSAEFVLALLTLGAKEPAHNELLTSLGIPNDDAIRSSFTSVSSTLRALKGVTLNVANKVYIKDGPYELVPKLKEDAVKVFDAEFEKVEFGESVAAAAKINQWVEDKTNKKIKDLISADALSDDTRLVLVNALYFKGSWKTKFDPTHTMNQPFHVNAQTTIEIPMMFKKANFKLGASETLGAQFLEMPYEGEEASMVIVLPNEVEGLNDVMAKLASGHDLISDLEQMHKVEVEVTIPKFKIETEIDLIPLLQKLGIKSIFDSKTKALTDLLSPPEPLYVSKAVQKAFIEVNEEGAEAAAATGFAGMTYSITLSPRFIANRPFLYILLGPNHDILFTGGFRGPVQKRSLVGFMKLCAMIDFSTPRFTVDRPFFAVIMVKGRLCFVGVYRDE